MRDDEKRPCPECGARVEWRYVPSADGLGVLPFAVEFRVGPEHERSCRWYRRES